MFICWNLDIFIRIRIDHGFQAEILIFFYSYTHKFPISLLLSSLHLKSFVSEFSYAFSNLFSYCFSRRMHQWFDSIIYAQYSQFVCWGFKWNGVKLVDKVLYIPLVCTHTHTHTQFPGWWWICQLRMNTKYKCEIYANGKPQELRQCLCTISNRVLKSTFNWIWNVFFSSSSSSSSSSSA